MVEKEVADYALDQLGLRLPPNDEARQQANTEQGIALSLSLAEGLVVLQALNISIPIMGQREPILVTQPVAQLNEATRLGLVLAMDQLSSRLLSLIHKEQGRIYAQHDN